MHDLNKATVIITSENRLSDEAQAKIIKDLEACGVNAFIPQEGLKCEYHPPVAHLADAIERNTATVAALADSISELVNAMVMVENEEGAPLRPTYLELVDDGDDKGPDGYL